MLENSFELPFLKYQKKKKNWHRQFHNFAINNTLDKFGKLSICKSLKRNTRT